MVKKANKYVIIGIGINFASSPSIEDYKTTFIKKFVKINNKLIFLYNFFFSDDLTLAFIVSTSLVAVIVFAAIFGTLVPLMLNKYKIDPALATGPFITTVNDVLGLFIYFMIGQAIL